MYFTSKFWKSAVSDGDGQLQSWFCLTREVYTGWSTCKSILNHLVNGCSVQSHILFILITDIRPEWNSHLSDGFGSKCFLRNTEGEGNGSKSPLPRLTSSTPVAKQMDVPATSHAEEQACSFGIVCASVIRHHSSACQEMENYRKAEISHWLEHPQWFSMKNNEFK